MHLLFDINFLSLLSRPAYLLRYSQRQTPHQKKSRIKLTQLSRTICYDATLVQPLVLFPKSKPTTTSKITLAYHRVVQVSLFLIKRWRPNYNYISAITKHHHILPAIGNITYASSLTHLFSSFKKFSFRPQNVSFKNLTKNCTFLSKLQIIWKIN